MVYDTGHPLKERVYPGLCDSGEETGFISDTNGDRQLDRCSVGEPSRWRPPTLNPLYLPRWKWKVAGSTSPTHTANNTGATATRKKSQHRKLSADKGDEIVSTFYQYNYH